MTVVRVLHSIKRGDALANPFVNLFFDSLPSQVISIPFSWRYALLSRYDVVHFQWPEALLLDRTRLRRIARLVLFLALMLRLAMLRIPVVLTVHNIEPHERLPRIARRAMRALDARVSTYVQLNSVPLPFIDPARSVVIPHGNYRPCLPERRAASGEERELLYFGMIRPYKQVPRLIEAFRNSGLPGGGVCLRVVGRPNDESLALAVHAGITELGQVASCRLESVPHVDLCAEILRCSAVVLPYDDLYNSGSLVLALSLDRPVIAPSSPSTRSFQQRLGSTWLALYEGELDGGKLEIAYRQLADRQEERDFAALDDLDWGPLGARYARVYIDLLRDGRGQTRPAQQRERGAL